MPEFLLYLKLRVNEKHLKKKYFHFFFVLIISVIFKIMLICKYQVRCHLIFLKNFDVILIFMYFLNVLNNYTLMSEHLEKYVKEFIYFNFIIEEKNYFNKNLLYYFKFDSINCLFNFIEITIIKINYFLGLKDFESCIWVKIIFS
jgi:hypothetical protein